MSTNYYVKQKNEDKVIHIGKSSYKWAFTFQATDTIKTYEDWTDFLLTECEKGSIIIGQLPHDKSVRLEQ